MILMFKEVLLVLQLMISPKSFSMVLLPLFMTLQLVFLNQMLVIKEHGINAGKKPQNKRDTSSVKVFSVFSLMELKNVPNYIIIVMNVVIV